MNWPSVTPADCERRGRSTDYVVLGVRFPVSAGSTKGPCLTLRVSGISGSSKRNVCFLATGCRLIDTATP